MNRSTVLRSLAIVTILSLGVVAVMCSRKSPPREFLFEKTANLITAYPIDGGYVSENENEIARSQWSEKFGAFGQPGRFTRITRDGRGLAFAIHQD